MDHRHNFGVIVVSLIVVPFIIGYSYYNWGKVESIIIWSGDTMPLDDNIYNEPQFDLQWVINDHTCEDFDLQGANM